MNTLNIQETISYLLAQVCKAHRNVANSALNSLDLHVGQEMVLLQLSQEDGLTQSQLAERMCVEAPTLTRMLQRMERDLVIRRLPDREDARISRVYLTQKALELQPAIEQCWSNLEAQTLAGLTAEERMLLRRLLMQVRTNLT
ncbi:MAG: MarR family transcriptional regulator [Herpetosiphonaceae bacterium]|nr:MarR family transcriptional regulator [Herpetosiphonaceae bacterium]